MRSDSLESMGDVNNQPSHFVSAADVTGLINSSTLGAQPTHSHAVANTTANLKASSNNNNSSSNNKNNNHHHQHHTNDNSGAAASGGTMMSLQLHNHLQQSGPATPTNILNNTINIKGDYGLTTL